MPALLPLLSLLKNPWVLLLIVGLAGVAGTGWYRMRWEGCVAARAEDRVKAEQAKSAALEHAKNTSDAIIVEQAQALAATANRAAPVVERITHAPVTTGCGPVLRDAARGVRSILDSGGGETQAGGGPPAAVPAAKGRDER
jgi:hypothetical protein